MSNDDLDRMLGVCDDYRPGRIDERGQWYCGNCGWTPAAHAQKPWKDEEEDDDDGA